MQDGKKSYGQLRQELKGFEDKITIGAAYAHYKHPELPYTAVGFAVREETDDVAVLYRPLHEPEVTFVRPASAWLETVEWQGKTVPRFRKLPVA